MCLVPALPGEVRLETLHSIFNQSVPVACTILLTEKVKAKMSFPAKISLVMNGMLENLRLENFDYLLRVDADTVLPVDFVEGNLRGCAVVGYGPAQLIEVASFIKFMGGRFHPEHDDGYPVFKFLACGLNVKRGYFVEPCIQRVSGRHQGSSWFLSQGELHYKYGYDPVSELAVVVGKWRQYHPYGLFYLVGYFWALVQRKKLFDVGAGVLYRGLNKFKHPSRFLRVFTVEKYKNRLVGLVKNV